ncbi:hypothetical protein [Maribacter sp. 2307UL18-2]|uniref:hypothetical protein n=1 Tax=Maribacter sp. 2307UL18-2 TaxID=3386274 RepID=UPI0039BC9204
MKNILCLALLYLFISCSKDSAAPEPVRKIQLSYPESEINATFRTAGGIAPNIIQWNGDVGFYSITSSTEILRRDHIVFDSLTGQISWGKNLPLGSYDFTITAESGETTETVEILLTNSLIKAFFSGGFEMVDPDVEEIDYSAIPVDYALWLNEDGTVAMERYSNPAFSAAGNWTTIEGGSILVDFITNLSGGETTYMRGYLANSAYLPKFTGDYGSAVNENQEIEERTGVFRFEWD